MELNKKVTILYTNYKGETRYREIIPKSIEFKATNWHKEEQWILNAYDLEKEDDRGFALKDIKAKNGIQEYERQKQILYIRTDMSNMERYKIADKNEAVLQFYRTRLVNLGDMRALKNYIAITHGKFRGGKLEKGALEHEKAC